MTKGTATRQRVVERAWQLATREGLAGVSLGRLATELGLSKSGLFAHFASKEALELEVLQTAAERFGREVLKEAFKEPRGLPRLRKLFQHWLAWIDDPRTPGGCVFLAASVELDDRSGPLREFLAASQGELQRALAKSARLAIEAGHFRPDVDGELFAFQLLGVMLACHHTRRLLRDPNAEQRARAAFEALVATASPTTRAEARP